MNHSTDKMIAYLISEEVTSAKAEIIAKPQGTEGLKVRTTLQNAARFNRNGRRYPKPTLNEGLSNQRVVEMLKKKSWCGEVGHPHNPTLQRQMTIDPTNISHRINKWWWEGDLVKAEVEGLNTRLGNEFQSLIQQELETAYSLRAVGPLKETREGKIVQSPLTVVTYDWVFVPSHDDAYQDGIINSVTENNNGLSESFCLPLLESQMLDFVTTKDTNVKVISEMLEFCKGDIRLSNDMKNVILTESVGTGKDRLVISLDEYCSKEISGYMSNMFK